MIAKISLKVGMENNFKVTIEAMAHKQSQLNKRPLNGVSRLNN
jgi:hypothetical protein